MYKKFFLTVISMLLTACLCGCSIIGANNDESGGNAAEATYVKSVFITYYELSKFTKSSNDLKAFKKAISKAFKNLSSKGFNRVTVQVRPCADAFYNSSYFPVSEYCFSYQGAELKYDPLEVMTAAAHKYNLAIEAWVNPYRVSQSNDFSSLAKSNIALKWKGTDKLIVTDSGIYFNPCFDEVTDLTVNGIKEIVANYDVDSVCIDDYFYPVKDSDIDEKEYEEYKDGGGDKSLPEWRRNNVSNMVKSVYKAVKDTDKNVTFGISPAADMDNDYSSLYADVKKWATEEGYVDYMCPQVYFGFENESLPFMQTVKKWRDNANCTLYIALALYKAGKTDEFAGESGINEFKNSSNIISRQVDYLSKLNDVGGFYIFSYSSLKDNEETSKLYSAMQNSPSSAVTVTSNS